MAYKIVVVSPSDRAKWEKKGWEYSHTLDGLAYLRKATLGGRNRIKSIKVVPPKQKRKAKE